MSELKLKGGLEEWIENYPVQVIKFTISKKKVTIKDIYKLYNKLMKQEYKRENMSEYKLTPPKNIYTEEYLKDLKSIENWIKDKTEKLELNNPFKKYELDFLIGFTSNSKDSLTVLKNVKTAEDIAYLQSQQNITSKLKLNK